MEKGREKKVKEKVKLFSKKGNRKCSTFSRGKLWKLKTISSHRKMEVLSVLGRLIGKKINKEKAVEKNRPIILKGEFQGRENRQRNFYYRKNVSNGDKKINIFFGKEKEILKEKNIFQRSQSISFHDNRDSKTEKQERALEKSRVYSQENISKIKEYQGKERETKEKSLINRGLFSFCENSSSPKTFLFNNFKNGKNTSQPFLSLSNNSAKNMKSRKNIFFHGNNFSKSANYNGENLKSTMINQNSLFAEKNSQMINKSIESFNWEAIKRQKHMVQEQNNNIEIVINQAEESLSSDKVLETITRHLSREILML